METDGQRRPSLAEWIRGPHGEGYFPLVLVGMVTLSVAWGIAVPVLFVEEVRDKFFTGTLSEGATAFADDVAAALGQRDYSPAAGRRTSVLGYYETDGGTALALDNALAPYGPSPEISVRLRALRSAIGSYPPMARFEGTVDGPGAHGRVEITLLREHRRWVIAGLYISPPAP